MRMSFSSLVRIAGCGVDFEKTGVAVGMAGRASRLQIGMLIMHGVAGLEMHAQRDGRWHFQAGFRRGLLSQDGFSRGMDRDVATGRLASGADVSRHVELRPAMLGVATHAGDFFLFVHGARLLVRVTGRALASGNASNPAWQESQPNPAWASVRGPGL